MFMIYCSHHTRYHARLSNNILFYCPRSLVSFCILELISNALCHICFSPHSAPGDYEVLNTQLVFSAGASTGAVVCTDLQVTDDNVVEEDVETLTLTMSADDPPVTTTTALVATVNIRENDNDGK